MGDGELSSMVAALYIGTNNDKTVIVSDDKKASGKMSRLIQLNSFRDKFPMAGKILWADTLSVVSKLSDSGYLPAGPFDGARYELSVSRIESKR
jgi:hypothetical protein